jgi:hypothetical protein
MSEVLIGSNPGDGPGTPVEGWIFKYPIALINEYWLLGAWAARKSIIWSRYWTRVGVVVALSEEKTPVVLL